MRRYEDNDVLQVPPPKAATQWEQQSTQMHVAVRFEGDKVTARRLLDMLGLTVLTPQIVRAES